MSRPPVVAALRARLRPVALWFTRSSHRELLTSALRPSVEALHGVVLDIGGGRNSPLAAHWPEGATRIRVDISPRFEPNVLGDAQQLPVATASVDGAVMSEVLEHVPHPDRAIAEIARTLRPGGLLVGSVQVLRCPSGNTSGQLWTTNSKSSSWPTRCSCLWRSPRPGRSSSGW